MKKNTLLCILIALINMIGFSQSTATYTIVFDSNWSQTAHPHASGSLPGSAHWSKLVGATHNEQITFLEMGVAATPGVKNIAELGSNGAFFAEVDAAIDANMANQRIDGPSLGTAQGQMIINSVSTTEAYPFLTLASMIAPSPDWMIAVNSIALVDANGDWKDEITLDLYPYDAGTDSGTDYTSGNVVTSPQGTIENAQGTTPFSNEKIGTLTITLDEVLGDASVQKNDFQLFPNPTEGMVTIRNSSKISTIEVYNILGKLVLQNNRLNSATLSLNLDQFPSGVYLVKVIDTDNKETIKKVIKR